MTSRLLLKLVILTFPLITTAHADTNAAGDEITYIPETAPSNPSNRASGMDMQLSPQLATQPDAISDTTEPDTKTNNLWQRIKGGYAMPEVNSPFTANHESWYAARPDYVKRMVGRSEKYLYHIVEEVQKRGMPTEIALLPMVESAFNPQAYSTSRASGIWQFIPSTGKNFGLQQNWWVDNRRDVKAATDAALTYLQKLHVMFGSWDLALAAYNAGEGTVMRAIERNRRKGLPTDYQSLNLPPETRNYVPKLQAVKNIVNNPEQYGLDIKPIPDQPYFTQVTAPKQIDTKLAAQLAGVSLEEFVSLNPEYNRPVLTATDSAHEILLPVGKDAEFTSNLANYDKPLVSWQTYMMKRGEKLDHVARKFGVSVAELRDVNDIGARGRAPRQLLVPSQGDSATAELETDNPAAGEVSLEEDDHSDGKRYTAKKGERLDSIAKRFGTTSRKLMALNHLKSSRIKPGQVLLVRASSSTSSAAQPLKSADKKTPSSGKNKRYVVRKGDTLAEIAHKFDVEPSDLKRWNHLRSSRITPGHKLIVAKSE